MVAPWSRFIFSRRTPSEDGLESSPGALAKLFRPRRFGWVPPPRPGWPGADVQQEGDPIVDLALLHTTWDGAGLRTTGGRQRTTTSVVLRFVWRKLNWGESSQRTEASWGLTARKHDIELALRATDSLPATSVLCPGRCLGEGMKVCRICSPLLSFREFTKGGASQKLRLKICGRSCLGVLLKMLSGYQGVA